MPYKDPERKRQWEKEHREQRNARRRMRRLSVPSGHVNAANASPDPAPDQQRTSGWKVLLGFAVGLGVLVLAAVAGVNPPPPGGLGGLPGSGESGT